MAHTTQTDSHAKEHEHYGEPGARHAAVAHDPEHDIDARSATLWVVGGAIVLFLSLWVMLPIFLRVQHAERRNKVDLAPNTELGEVVDAERQFLRGQNPTKKTIDQVLEQMSRK